MVRKPSMGRQKIEIKRIEQEDSRQVTFSKRRAGLFKKASELCILCGAQTSIIVFSPAGKVFSFVHPSVEAVVDRYLSGSPAAVVAGGNVSLIDAHRGVNQRELTRQHTELVHQFEAEKKKGEQQQQLKKANEQNVPWWEGPIENLGLHELERLQHHLDQLKTRVTNRADEIMSRAPFFPQMNAMNSIGMPDHHYETKPNPNNPAMVPRAYGFGYGGYAGYTDRNMTGGFY
ncbi:Agamous-like mads-box protein agl62 [Thalictrum thalictroides]|uniref:Agamous-like mads-box protein agl62 n=1 Tax=Thalictrum thalictroides TaxID=46969 RepID=A0A7J6WXI7_THATH|nr:Agamous-like mads-box protein agl62 [Thalictrum thalictroides]